MGMGKDQFEFARIASPEEIVDYLTSLAVGLKRGEVTLESGERTLHLTPPSELKLDLKVVQKEHKGKLKLQLGWKRQASTRLAELRVQAPSRSDRH
jgi:amphi-Trp domain-containing protein